MLVVDNGSSTPFPPDVADRWPGVLTLANGENLGFTGGMNVGIRAALAQGAHTVTILNNDTVVGPGAIAALAGLVESAELEGRPIAVSPEVRYRSRPEDVWFGGGAIDPATNLPHHVAPVAPRQRRTRTGCGGPTCWPGAA